MRSILIAATAASLVMSSAPAFAAQCRDPKTKKFIKCPEQAAPKGAKCRLNGKFAKCSTPGAKPA